MKNIKFRAWNKLSNKMYKMYGFTLNTSGEIIAQNENIVMQFTGVVFKPENNFKTFKEFKKEWIEIYEKDYVHDNYYFYSIVWFRNGFKARVLGKYNNGNLKFYDDSDYLVNIPLERLMHEITENMKPFTNVFEYNNK